MMAILMQWIAIKYRVFNSPPGYFDLRHYSDDSYFLGQQQKFKILKVSS